jgi:hypothetical protein
MKMIIQDTKSPTLASSGTPFFKGGFNRSCADSPFEKGGARRVGDFILCLAFLFLSTSFLSIHPIHAATPSAEVNPNDPGFNFIVCDGPRLPPTYKNPPANYRVCDFNALMTQVQKLINIAMVAGVFVAIGGFCYMGYLFMTGKEDDRKKGKEIFPKIFIGFIIMLSAWFIVYQLLGWLLKYPSLRTLLGSP